MKAGVLVIMFFGIMLARQVAEVQELKKRLAGLTVRGWTNWNAKWYTGNHGSL